jgi:hypothetical protein
MIACSLGETIVFAKDFCLRALIEFFRRQLIGL